jgi:ribonuclease HI
VAVFADESCLGNGREGDNPGGAGGVVEFMRAGGELVRRDYWVSEPATTNNRMALRSATEAMRALSAKNRSCDVVFFSDSSYLINGMKDWVHGWARRGWTKKGGEILNLQLWWEAVDAARAHRVSWQWVRGHDGHPQNEYAHFLANRAAAEQTESGGLVESGFVEWEVVLRASKRRKGAIHPFPDPASFRPDRPLPAAPAARQQGIPSLLRDEK